MIICKECSCEISDADVFCPYCGIRVEKKTEEAAVSLSETEVSVEVVSEKEVFSAGSDFYEKNSFEVSNTSSVDKPIPGQSNFKDALQTDTKISGEVTPLFSEQKTKESQKEEITSSGLSLPDTSPEIFPKEEPGINLQRPAISQNEAPSNQELQVTEKSAKTDQSPAANFGVDFDSMIIDIPAPKILSQDLEGPESLQDSSKPPEKFSAVSEQSDDVASGQKEVFGREEIPINDIGPKEASQEFVESNSPEIAHTNKDAVSEPEASADFNESAGISELQTGINQIGQSDEAEARKFGEDISETSSGTSKQLLEEPRPILPPDEILDEPVSLPSVFDSVSIMESDIAGFQSPVEEPGRKSSQISLEESKSQDAIGQAAQSPSVNPDILSAVASEDLSEPKGTSAVSQIDSDGKKSAKLKPLPEGTILNGRYEVIRKIGGGGMGAVYLAADRNLGGVLRAVKEMVQSHIEEHLQEKAYNDFKRESLLLTSLDHPAIPTIFDYFYDDSAGRFYLVMKYISGGDLASRLRAAPDGTIDELTVTEWAIQITDVLNYLHNQPQTIVYRDLKPSNIMIDGNSGRIMLIDFGIARSISQKEEKGVTAVGTMGYAPPELFSGNVEPRSDIYSLGSTMFHLLTGADPQSNPLLIFDFQKNPRPRQINPRISDQIERIIMKAVEYNAEKRFSSAAEMKAVLEDHLAKLRAGTVTYGVGEVPVSVSLANQMVFCGFCGQKIVATDLFCAFCGAKQPLAQKGVHSEIYKSAAIIARLVVEGTSDLSAPVYSLEKDEVLIGRRDPTSNIFPEVDLSKYDPQTKISRRHAKIRRDGTNYILEDLGSSNGTVIEPASANPFRLPPRHPYRLNSGDRIRLGDTRLHFIIG
ncbi:MAG TPA: protein kinase [Pyrinomonadaceae bacterium]|nr:protein kinase [Pyrinomonadaceae bacterium]